MRAVSVHADVIVLTSRVWQTTCTIVRGGDESFVIDSPVFPDELELLPTLLHQAGFRFSGLLATHGDWDHLLGRLAFPEAALGVCETTAARLRGTPAEAQRELRDFDDEHYVVRPKPLSLGRIEEAIAEIGEALRLDPDNGQAHQALARAHWVGKGDFADKVKSVLEDKSEKVVLIKGDQDALYSAIMQAMDDLRKAGIEDIGLITEKKEAKTAVGGN